MRPYNDNETKGAQVERMFDGIAPRYDLLNHLLSLGIDRIWRRRVVKMMTAQPPTRVLDLAAGTGDMSIAVAKRFPDARVTAADASHGMLEVAERKIASKRLADRVDFVHVSAEDLPFSDGDFDAVTVAFGVRNFDDMDKGLSEMCRVLKRGGVACILEFSTPHGKIFGALFRFYFHRVMPFVGRLVSGDSSAYRYLPESVDEFPPPQEFMAIMERNGCRDCRAKSLTGGVAMIYTGVKY
jgi:demethylmenaquinone methyltransferase/2-methoxy-6-polyprenyl-1,4-benzoquinol methylase